MRDPVEHAVTLQKGAGTIPICRSANGAADPMLVIPLLLLAVRFPFDKSEICP